MTVSTSAVTVPCWSDFGRSRVFGWTCSNIGVLDRDSSLVGELEQRHFLVGEAGVGIAGNMKGPGVRYILLR